MRKSLIGAKVVYDNLAGYFLADVMQVGNAYVISSSRPITHSTLECVNDPKRVDAEATHYVTSMYGGFFRLEHGALVVPNRGLSLLPPGKTRIRQEEKFAADIRKEEKFAADSAKQPSTRSRNKKAA